MVLRYYDGDHEAFRWSSPPVSLGVITSTRDAQVDGTWVWESVDGGALATSVIRGGTTFYEGANWSRAFVVAGGHVFMGGPTSEVWTLPQRP